MTATGPASTETGLVSRLNALLSLDSDDPQMLYRGRWYSWNEAARMAGIVRGLARSLPDGQTIAVICRNHPLVLGAVLGLLAERRCVFPLSVAAPGEAMKAEIAEVGPVALLALPEDLARAGVCEAAAESGAAVLEVHDGDITLGASAASGPREASARTRVTYPEGTAFVLQTSGTTGRPKRVPVSYANIAAAITAMQTRAGHGTEPVRLRRSVAIVNTQLSHTSGMLSFCLNCVEGRRLALLDKFETWPWAELVRDYQVRSAGVPPAALAMLVDSDIPPEWLSSLTMIRSGTAPLDPQLALRFEERFGVPVVQAYGATEFQGIASWSLADYQRWRDSKRGSVGRPHRGVELRVTNPESGAELPEGERGRLWIRTAQSSIRTEDGWVPTNDIASTDSDGFLWIHGRTDDIINRGGLKIDAAAVASMLETHPDVSAAAVIGIPDRRLGEVPCAAVVMRADAPAADAAEVKETLRSYLRERLAPYMIPADFALVDALPTNSSMKVDRGAVKALFLPGSP